VLCLPDLRVRLDRDRRPGHAPAADRRAQALKWLLSKSHPGIAYNRHFDVEGSIVFHHLTLIQSADRTDCPTLQEAVMAWHRLPPQQTRRATIKRRGPHRITEISRRRGRSETA
jgi:hypothetical protein